MLPCERTSAAWASQLASYQLSVAFANNCHLCGFIYICSDRIYIRLFALPVGCSRLSFDEGLRLHISFSF